MSLIRCKDCGHEVSEKADKCPKCGAPVKSGGIGCGTVIVGFIFLLIILAVIGHLVDQGSNPDKSNSRQSAIALHSPTPVPTPAGKSQATQSSKAPDTPSYYDKWQVVESISVMDNSPLVVLELLAENTIEGWLVKYRPVLVVRCKENKTDVYVVTGMSANPEYELFNEYTVRIKFDKNKPFKQRWSESTDRKALFAPRPISLAKQIAKAKTMLFEFVPFNSNPAVVIFDVRGLDKHLGKVATACNWRYK